jgi:hypothetical protein
MKQTMTPVRLEELVLAYGSDPKRWPENERGDALMLLECSPKLRERMREAQTLDTALDRVPSDVPAAAMARVMASIERGMTTDIKPAAKRTFSFWNWGGISTAMWPRAAAFAGIAMLGIFIGLSSDPSALTPTESAFDGSVNTGETSLIGEFASWLD